MLYEFEDMATGERVERSFSMSSAPSIGDVIEVDGRRLRRVVSDFVVGERGFRPFVSRSLPNYDPHAPRYDSQGRAVFHSLREVREMADKRNGSKAGEIAGKLEWT